ncbi:MAG: glycosyltransferase family 9 protein [Chloroflexi bacterium]|nr:glycosyltransferase family 9 protein [Chloroflexota bacterium]
MTMSGAIRNVLGEMGPSPKIAILRGGGIGDFLSITAALRALKKSVPGAHTTLITTPGLSEFCQRYPSIDRIILAPRYQGVNDGPVDPAKVNQFFAQMRREKLDLALQWHGGGRNSNPFVSSLGARVTAGFRSDDAAALDIWLPYDHHHHEVLRYLDLVTLLGSRTDGVHTELPLVPDDYADLGHLAHSIDLDALREGRYIGFHVSAGAPSRRWPPERFAAVANALLAEHDLAGIIVTAGQGQDSDAAAVISRIEDRRRAINLAGRTSLGGLAALISQLRLYVSNDSGPAHMAVALGTPCVVVFGSGNPINWAPLERAWHRPVADLSSPCRWMVHDGCKDEPTVPCLQGVQVEAVLRETHSLLGLKNIMSWPASCEECSPNLLSEGYVSNSEYKRSGRVILSGQEKSLPITEGGKRGLRKSAARP